MTDFQQSNQLRPDFDFVLRTLQKGRVRQSTFIHELVIPESLYIELRDNRIIDHSKYHYFKSNLMLFTVWFEFRHSKVIISFQHQYYAEAFHHMIDKYLVEKYIKPYPVERLVASSMNFERIEAPGNLRDPKTDIKVCELLNTKND